MARKRRGKSARKARASQLSEADKFKNAPHTFVLNKGVVGPYVKQLVADFRRVMEPYTASRLKATRNNCLQDFLNVAGTFGVSHIMIFTRTESKVQMKLVKVPRGPTLTFHVDSYTLAKDVLSGNKRPVVFQAQYLHHPLLIVNGLDENRKEHKVLHANLQAMFPSISVHETPLDAIRRCVLVNYDSENDRVDLRHYAIKLAPVGVSKAVKKIMQSKVPKMGKYEDVADYILNPQATSESEAELEPNEVDLHQDVRERGITSAGKCSIRLSEIGPRLSLRLVRIQSDAGAGTTLYSTNVQEVGGYQQASKRRRKARKRAAPSANSAAANTEQ